MRPCSTPLSTPSRGRSQLCSLLSETALARLAESLWATQVLGAPALSRCLWKFLANGLLPAAGLYLQPGVTESLGLRWQGGGQCQGTQEALTDHSPLPAAQLGTGIVMKALALETSTLFLPLLEGHFREDRGLVSCSLTFPTHSDECWYTGGAK